MLHCKQMNGRSKRAGEDSACDNISHDENSRRKISIKKEHTLDSVCRVCLKKGCIPIYGNKTAEDLSESFNTFAGIEIKLDDPYPKYLCEPCNTLLLGAIKFRKSAQQSDEILKRPPEDLLTDGIDDTFNYPEDNNDSWEYEEHKTSENLTYHCKKCEISFDTFKDYDDHRMTEEHENRKITCPICNNSYAELYFKRHLALHKDNASYMCDICGKNFLMQGQFTRHRLTHFYKLPFKCSLCPYKGRFSESLKMHMRSHTGEKPYQCSQCPSRFINKSNLNIHSLRHKGEHNFKCETCGRGFYTKRELELHFKVDHTGIKEHICNICGKEFGYRKHMMKHQLKVHKRAKLRSGRMPLYLQVENMKQQGQDLSGESEAKSF